MDELVDELENVIEEDSSNVGSVEDGNKASGSYTNSQLEDDLEGSIAGANTNLSDFTEASGSNLDNYNKPEPTKPSETLNGTEVKFEDSKSFGKKGVEVGRILARRGLFSSDVLNEETLFTGSTRAHDYQRTRRYQAADTNVKDLNDPGLNDKSCVLRLPEYAADLVKERLAKSEPLGITVTPTGRYDFREYKVEIKGLITPLFAILGELPCVIEAHKTLNNDLLFKSADISQLMIAYEKDQAEKVAEILKDRMWEWPDGLTPGTKNIRKRRFKNYDDYSNEEIKEAERESLILMNGLVRDTYHFEIKTTQDVNDLVASYRAGNIKERVIGPDEDVAVYIKALEEQENEEFPDLSEIMFDSDIGNIPNKFIYNNIKNRIFNNPI
ncbi:TAFII55 protein conserved region family protein [Theileria parva strain Muguga]|uniref:TAFII55 protein conserved region domain-containing protein n=1 Tax=Theileria parva TaxID=5875 RepID=Q4N4U3_THEPA|nr:TAFII55 protein conserved region family protein [Theileria parva strain Muguga]EAN32830.1 TAFII55 protein conserved region family protein [Theileria parva strain Muguga]|eukprot:XP_765113.1 hypothetical protein [Theileria parva strain Muguga]